MHFSISHTVHEYNIRQDGRAVKALASGASREICVGSSPTLVIIFFCVVFELGGGCVGVVHFLLVEMVGVFGTGSACGALG